MNNFLQKFAIFILCLATTKGIASPVGLSSFSVIQYNVGNQPANANWVLGGGNTSVTQTNNNEPSTFLSDFSIVNSIVEFDVRVGVVDDDNIGFVFGYQDIGSFYQFDWVKDSNNVPHQKMRLLRTNAGNVDPHTSNTFQNLISSSSNSGWFANTDYHILLSFIPGQIDIDVTQNGTLLDSLTLSDSTFTSGQFGFYTGSQENVAFSNLEINAVPIPAAMWLFGSGLVGFFGLNRHKVNA